MINNRIWGPEFNKKEAEIRKLKLELARIDADKAQPSLFMKTQSIPIPAPLFTSYQPFYNPPKQSIYDQFFGLSHLHSTNLNIPSVPSENRLHQNDLSQKSKSPNLNPKKIFIFQKTLLKQLLNLQRKTKLQLTNTIISRLITKTVTQKVYPPLIILAHLNKRLQTPSPNNHIFLVF